MDATAESAARGCFSIANSIATTGRDFLQAAIYIGLVFFVVNVVAVGVFNITGTALIVANILPTIFAIVVILKTMGKL